MFGRGGFLLPGVSGLKIWAEVVEAAKNGMTLTSSNLMSPTNVLESKISQLRSSLKVLTVHEYQMIVVVLNGVSAGK